MQIYKYDEITKEFIGIETAQLDPLESELQRKEVWLLPANTTFIAPLIVKDGYAQVFKDGVWNYVEDNRGKEYWLADDEYGTPAREMKELGAFPEGGVFEAPEKSFEALKEEKFNEIKNSYLEELYAPVWFEQTMAQPNGETGPKAYVGYDTDQNSQIDFNSSYKRAQLKGSTLYNIYVNPDDLGEKEFTYHTPEMFDAALLAAGEYQEGVYVKYYTVKAQVEAATTKEELEAIRWA